jgi:acyl dehydratase
VVEQQTYGIQPGYEIPTLTKGPVTRVQLAKYAGASGDFNPIHLDDEIAQQSGVGPTVIAHGMLSMAFIAQMLTDWVGPTNLRRLSVRFTAMVRPGDVLTCRGRVEQVRTEGERVQADCEVWIDNQRGERVLTGRAFVDLPRREG